MQSIWCFAASTSLLLLHLCPLQEGGRGWWTVRALCVTVQKWVHGVCEVIVTAWHWHRCLTSFMCIHMYVHLWVITVWECMFVIFPFLIISHWHTYLLFLFPSPPLFFLSYPILSPFTLPPSFILSSPPVPSPSPPFPTLLLSVCSQLRKHDDCWVFIDPVTEEIAPGYFEIIEVTFLLARTCNVSPYMVSAPGSRSWLIYLATQDSTNW